MTTKQIVDNYSVSAPDTVESVFTSPPTKAVVVEMFTASNNSGINASYKAYIKSISGDIVPQIPFKIVVWGENDLGIGIVNQVIPPGGELLVESSATNSIYFTVTGREV